MMANVQHFNGTDGVHNGMKKSLMISRKTITYTFKTGCNVAFSIIKHGVTQ